MRKYVIFPLLILGFVICPQFIFSQHFSFNQTSGNHGISLEDASSSSVRISFGLSGYYLEDVDVNGEKMKSIKIENVFLPNNEGAPDLPGMSQLIAIPQNSSAQIEIISAETETVSNVKVAPAPRIPLDTEKGPLHYEKDTKYYSKNEFYPNETVILSEPTTIRGVDVVMLGITPFQYNPVSEELIIFKEIELRVTFNGGNGQFGDKRLRSRWWDPILNTAILNSAVLPQLDHNKKIKLNTETPDHEYLIIVPDDPVFLQWADSIKLFRNQQGIKTGIVTTTDIGGNTVSAIETYVNDAYYNWDNPPSAVLLLGDYNTGAGGITSQAYTHPAGFPDFVSDNKFADVTGNDLPDIAFARITANDAAQLEVMVTKFLDYERNPPTDPDFYDHPITALGWQTERWFQICSEVVGGYFANVHGKNPVRINAVYDGNPSTDPWSTATNTTTVLNYFGPSGLGYIPSTPQELGGFSGGTTTDVVNAINSGSFLLQHRDHGSYSGWGEPAFSTTSINSLNNVNNKLPYIFSINCQTGAFHRSSETFTEKFHRYTYNNQNSGALGVMAATEVSYSFVNDTYLWGVIDNLFPDFMPAESTAFPVDFAMPAFGNAAGKHFLYQSSWPYNTSSKQITYRLFHHHGGAFLTIYSEVPQSLNVVHDAVLMAGNTNFAVTADAGSLIALTVNGEIIGTADGTGSSVNISIPAQNPGDVVLVTVTKQNHFRYSQEVNVIADGVYAQFEADITDPCSGDAVTFSDMSYGSITSWEWTFPGGTPASFSGQNPPAVIYNTPGTYSVSLAVSDGSDTDDEIKSDYINAYGVIADFMADNTTIVVGNSVTFTDLSGCSPDTWEWTFPGGNPSTFIGQVPPAIQYDTEGTYDVSLTVSNAVGSDTRTMSDLITVEPPVFNMQDGSVTTCQGMFYDSGGESGYYSNSEDYVLTFYPTSPGGQLEFVFTSFDVEPEASCSYDYLNIYDGESTAASLIGQYCGTDSPGTVTSSNATGAITFEWHSDGSITDPGWAAEISCTTNPPVADFSASTTDPALGSGVVFTDLSTYGPTSWLWTIEPASFTFVNGTNANSQNPEVQFNELTSYTVTLEVSNPYGTDTETKTNYINPVLCSYCDAGGSNGTMEWISNVTFNTIDNPSVASSGYTDYTSISTDLEPGLTYPVSVSCDMTSTSWTEHYWVFFDWNQDCDFDDPNEGYDLGQTTGPGTLSTDITVPETANGSLRMRVFLKFNSDPVDACDNFSYGEVEDYTVNVVHSTDLELSVFLEGPFDGSSMIPKITGLLPSGQPYNQAPWNYNGSESMSSASPEYIDWILVELRDASSAALAYSSTTIARQAALVTSTGDVVDVDGNSILHYDVSALNGLFVVIHHRNHIRIMSAEALTKSAGVYSYDFSSSSSQVYGDTEGHKELVPGIWGMITADGNNDGIVDQLDESSIWESQAGQSGFLESDYNLDGQSDNKDKNSCCSPNMGRHTMVPD